MTFIVAKITIDEDPIAYFKYGRISELADRGGTRFLFGMAIVSFGIPMNLIGISLGSIAQGLHPVSVIHSIVKTATHYIFLVLIVVVFAALFGSAFVWIVVVWLMPQVGEMIKGAKTGNIGIVALAMLAWGATMGIFFYGTYVIARIHGLFARSFRKKLLFGDD